MLIYFRILRNVGIFNTTILRSNVEYFIDKF